MTVRPLNFKSKKSAAIADNQVRATGLDFVAMNLNNPRTTTGEKGCDVLYYAAFIHPESVRNGSGHSLS